MTRRLMSGSARPVYLVDPNTKQIIQGSALPVALYDADGIAFSFDPDLYILADGTRAFTGDQSHGDFDITNVGDISLDTISGDAGLVTINDNVIIDGNADEIQLIVQGHTTQLTNLQEWQQSDNTVVLSVDNTGNFNAPATIEFNIATISVMLINASGIKLQDNYQIVLGGGNDYNLGYVAGSTSFRFNTTDVDGIGTNATLFHVTDGSPDFTWYDGLNHVLGTTTGTEFGTAANQKIGFFGATPIVQIPKASYNNWAAFGDVVNALVALGLFDAA